ncbi:hypothetical protein [Saccharothrix carnea]|uniref:hypothetical protein n=1 Tax=Saccharothrix carnea TaxID=1280637 RepID=UPI0011B1CD67|nr:hypothetical protein [Saccharothrix carnea]
MIDNPCGRPGENRRDGPPAPARPAQPRHPVADLSLRQLPGRRSPRRRSPPQEVRRQRQLGVDGRRVGLPSGFGLLTAATLALGLLAA